MPKTVDKYLIEKSLFQDDFLVQYLSCQHKILKKNFTIKKIDKPSQISINVHQKQNNFKLSYTCTCLQNEVAISRQLKSQRIIKCQKILKSKNSIFAVYDEHPQKTLHQAILTQYLTIERKQNILSEILQLVLWLHQGNIAVGNLSTKNIFLTQDYKIRISDFLIARKIQNGEIIQIDNFFLNENSQYYAPQLIKKGNLSKAADIYSLGQVAKSLHFEKSQHELLSPGKPFFDNLKNFIDKMVDSDPKERPLIEDLKNNLRLNQCRKSSIILDFNEQKIRDRKKFGFQSTISDFPLKSPDKIQPLKLKHYEVRKMMMAKNVALDQSTSYHSPRKLTLKYKPTIEIDDLQLQTTHRNFLQVPQTQRSRQINSPLSQKSVISSTETNDSKRIVTLKQKIQEVILIRNAVSFLLQMAQFVYDQNEAKHLMRCLIHEALGYVDSSITSMGMLVGQEGAPSDFLKQSLERSKVEKKKLMDISCYLNQGAQFKKQDQTLYCWQLRRFAKHILDYYSSQFTLLASTSQLSTTSSRTRPSHNLTFQQAKQREQKLFKTLLILKRLQYGTYYEFMKARMHHFDRKFWSEHYFEFQRTFGGKYFVTQIKDLMNRK